MVMHNYTVEEALKNVLSETISELSRLRKEKEEIDKRISQLEEEARSYDIALKGYLKRTGNYNSQELDINMIKKASSHKLRLQILAKHDSGRITVKDSSALLFNNGFIKSKRRSNAYQIVRGLLEEMVDEKIFEKIAPGEYRLVGQQSFLQ